MPVEELAEGGCADPVPGGNSSTRWQQDPSFLDGEISGLGNS